ncbi:MAG: FtsX-like permease family protein, partial [Planctomycetota bacterium]
SVAAADDTRRLLGIETAEPLFVVAGTFTHGAARKRSAITGVDRGATMTVPHDDDGRAVPLPESGVLLPVRLAELLGVREGDTVRFRPVRGEQREYEVPVGRVIQSLVGLGVYADRAWLNRLLGAEANVSSIQMTAAQDSAQRRSFLRDLKRYPDVEGISAVAEDRERLEREFISKLDAVTWIIVLFAGVIFFGSVLNSSLVALAERRREIATFRALGYEPGEISAMFLRQSMVLTMTGTLLGLPIGYAILASLAQQNQNDLFAMPCIIHPSSYVWTILLAPAFVLLAQWVVARDIRAMAWLLELGAKE